MPTKGLKITFFSLFLLISIKCQSQTQKVYITETGEKYHTTSCHYLRYSKIAITLEKAIKNSYRACKVCKPKSGSTPSHTTDKRVGKQYYSTNKKASAVQCSGTTQKERRCKHMTKSSNGRCYQH